MPLPAHSTLIPSSPTPGQSAYALALDTGVNTLLLPALQTCAATATGATTGTITAFDGPRKFVTVTSDSADKIVILPAPVIGQQVILHNGATGYELRSSAPATIAINGGAEANAESAIAANSTVTALCVSITAWKAVFLDADSDQAKVEVAAAA